MKKGGRERERERARERERERERWPNRSANEKSAHWGGVFMWTGSLACSHICNLQDDHYFEGMMYKVAARSHLVAARGSVGGRVKASSFH
jgi:hypothetical protein